MTDENLDLSIDRDALELEIVRNHAEVDIRGAITGGKISFTLAGASTLTLDLHDPDRSILRSSIFDTAVDLEFSPGIWFRFVQLRKSGDSLGLTFEDRSVARLRLHDSARKASRAKVTRAEFIKSLVREVKPPIDFYCPELDKVQKIGKAAAVPSTRTTSSGSSHSSGGITSSDGVTVKGSKANRTQIGVMNQVLKAAYEVTSNEKALLTLVAMIIIETEFYNNQGSGSDSVSYGVIQAIPGTSGRYGGGSFTLAQAKSIDFSVKSILRYSTTGWGNPHGGILGAARAHPDWSLGRIAGVVNNGTTGNGSSAMPVSGTYSSIVSARHHEAVQILKAYGGKLTGGGSTTTTETTTKKYEFTRGQNKKREDSWTAIQRLASEVKWFAYTYRGRLYYASGDHLMKAKPWATLSEESDGINTIDFDDDSGKVANTATISAESRLWVCPPGSVAVLEHMGRANGRWIVSTIERNLFDHDCSITLQRPAKSLPEPAPETTTKTTTSSSSPSAGGGSGKHVASPMKKILSISGPHGSGADTGARDLMCNPDAVIYAICDAKVIDVRSSGWWGVNPTGNVSLGDGIIQLECTVNIGPFRKGMHFGYGHAEKATVHVGQIVKAGEAIGHAGLANAWHVHFMANSGTSRGNSGQGDRDVLPYVEYARRNG